jgi:hypothetical protein
MNVKEDEFFKNIFGTIRKELQTIITISYIISIGIGMLFNAKKYSEFGINIFDYADVFFYLIAPFADIKILFFTLISLIIPYLIYFSNDVVKRKYPQFYSKANLGLEKRGWYVVLNNLAFGGMIIFYLFTAANLYGKISKKNIITQVNTTIKYLDNETEIGKLIGKTNDVIFLYQEENVIAIPIGSLVKQIEVK